MSEEKIDINAAVSNKILTRWFWIGCLAAIPTSIILGGSERIAWQVKNYSILYFGVLTMLNFIYARAKGVKFGRPVITEANLATMRFAHWSAFFVLGHALGFFTIWFFR